MLARSYRSMLPKGAKVRESAKHARNFEHVVRGRVRLRSYAVEGEHPSYAVQIDAAGRMHGREREWFPDGRLKYDAGWIHGKQHGLQRQWDERGRLIVRTRFVRGTGLDAWCSHRDRLGETREMKDGHRHGFERLWASSRTLWREAHFENGREHGIVREWRGARLTKKQYFVAGERVDRRAYERARRADPTLPALDPRFDRPTRRRPAIA
jgi:hypothetical protein